MGIFKKDYTVGIDIGSSSVKVAQFAQQDGGLRLIKADLQEIEPSAYNANREKAARAVFKFSINSPVIDCL